MARGQASLARARGDPAAIAYAIEVVAQLLASPLTFAELGPYVHETLRPLGISPRVTRAVLRLTGRARPQPSRIGPAGRVVRELEPTQRAAYLVNAALRLQDGLDTPGVGYSGAMRRERRYLILHREAVKGRDRAARLVDRAAARHGPVLRWRARLDARTSPECRAMHGRVFDVRYPPVLYGHVAYPGTAHASKCRCRAAKA